MSGEGGRSSNHTRSESEGSDWSVDYGFDTKREIRVAAEEQEFCELACLLGYPLQCPNATPASEALLRKAVDDPENIREFILEQAVTLAAGCDCVKPLQTWNKDAPASTPTCGLQQASLVANVDIEMVERAGLGDDVPYVLARTVRSNIQYAAAIEIGAVGAGNQAKRGSCMASAMQMFCGKGMEGIPKKVVEALLRY